MHALIQELWTESSRIILDRFGLKVPPCPPQIAFISRSDLKRFGGHFCSESETFFLPDSRNGFELLIRGVIFRETLMSCIPNLICEEAIRDVAMEYARQNLSKDETKYLINEWKKIPPIRIRSNLVYTSYKTIEWMISLGGNVELDSLIHELLSLAKYGMRLDLTDYVEHITIRTQEIEVGLDHTDIKIIDFLLNKGPTTYTKIANELEFSTTWISTKTNQLMDRHILGKYVSTPFSKIGIRNFHVLLSGPTSEEPSKFLAKCPFLFNLQHILNGPWQVLARLAIPNNPTSIKSLEQMSLLLSDKGIAVDILETHSAGMTNSFYHYNVITKRWEIPWTAMHGWGNRIDEESLHKAVPKIDVPAKTTDTYLDETDMHILELMNSGVSKSRALRTQLSIGSNRLTKRLKKLKASELIRKSWAVYNLGLTERVALRCHNRRYASIMDAWTREFPKAILHYGERRDLLIISELPSGGSSKMMRTLRNLRWPVSVSLLGGNVWGQWSFPTNSWDVDKQQWMAPQGQIETWIDSLFDETTPKILKIQEKPSSTR